MDNRYIDTLIDYMNGLSIKELQDWILDLAEQNSDLRKENKKQKAIIEFQRNRIKRLKEKLTNENK